MIFSELYSVYYNTVAKIIETAFNSDVIEDELRKCVTREAFSESVLTILPALKSGKWPLLKENFSPVLQHKPTMPLTILEKRWLKAICEDPKIKLFGVDFPLLDDVNPLFTKEDYRIFDKYSDGDPFEDENYINNFRVIFSAMKNNRPVRIKMLNRHRKKLCFCCRPKKFEYSLKDDKFRIIAEECKIRQFNLGRIISCQYCEEKDLYSVEPLNEKRKELTLLIKDERNALERVMLHFSEFEKQAERLEDNKYILKLNYYESDETEIVIRVLSFGPLVKVLAPEDFVNLIKQRLISQKICGLK